MLIAQPSPKEPKKSPYHNHLTDIGVEFDFEPLMRVEKVSLNEFQAQKIELNSYSAIILTSRVTAESLFEVSEKGHMKLQDTVKYICSSEPLASYLRKYVTYSKRRMLYGDGSFSSLMELILKNRKERMLLVLSEPHRADIPESMRWYELSFDKAILTKSVSNNLSHIEPVGYDLIALFSPGDVEALISQFEVGQLPMVVTYGESTSIAATEAGLRIAATVPSPEAPSMAKAIELLAQKRRRGEEIEPVDHIPSNEVELFKKSHKKRL